MLYVDGHTHLHDHVAAVDFLISAGTSFRHHDQAGNSERVQGVLCLADFSGAEGFERLNSAGTTEELQDWQVVKTKEEHSICLEDSRGDRLWVISGRQIVTRERLEVMALGTIEKIPDGLSLAATIEAVEKIASLPILPWGVGKWLGSRGSLVRSALERYGTRLALCDNGGRPWFWHPRIYSLARKKGVAVISGTDPLRISCDCRRVGSFGQIYPGEIDQNFPAAWVKKKILAEGVGSRRVGAPMSCSGFLTRQILLRQETGVDK